MMKNKLLLISILICFVLSLGNLLWAEEKKEDDGFSGMFLVGYRGVDLDGVESKYKEDYNLDNGARLFNFKFHFQPKGALKKYFDRVDFSLHNFGGDPFESMDISVVKYGSYKFKYDRRKSTYFYKDMLAGHDFHTYNFDRISDSASLKVWLAKAARLYFSFDRYTKQGSSTTSMDISRDEFEFDKPIDESSKEIAVGLDISVKGFSLVLEEKLRDYKNDYHFFIPGFNEGESMGGADLSYFFFNQPYDLRGFTHSARLSARPTDSFLIKASAAIISEEMRISYSEEGGGTTYLGSPFNHAYNGEGLFERDIQLFNLDISYLFSSKFAFVGAVRYNNLKQEGTFENYDIEMPFELEFNTTGCEAGIQYQAHSSMGITLGLRSESRKITEEGMEETTKRTGFFGNVKFNPAKWLKLTADYQMGSYEDPYTPVSATDSHRVRFTARTKFKHCYMSGSFLYKTAENDIDDGWKTERSQLNIRTGYNTKTFHLGVGYGLIFSKIEGDRNFVFYGRPATWNILYEGRSNLFDAYLYLFIKKNWTLGFYGNYYENEGSWGLKRIILKPFLKIDFSGGFMGQLAYRYIEFNENMYHFNDYLANIVEVSFGYKW